MPEQTITVSLSAELYRTAQRVAVATHQSLETVLQTSLAQVLPPLDDVAEEEANALAALTRLDDAALWRVATLTMKTTEQGELHDLLDRQSANQMTPDEQIRLQQLLDTYGALTVRKAHAYLLLARRGYRVPMQYH
jgi:predicted transcriptional regulator